ncbi:extracellular solute-binding protein [Pseudoroseicyclus aestuarii]|uniref:Spermidine/putrescine-binding protein n=1 Tax=Pseudoroseicyclus aestuarii TaxID=1795041 RepID=A0A318SXB3_9RHOB|nr:extracellular solute-binding protein [Pseudoroseicyclus aestuarii]PYE85985.1 spermidine/putrescine-binding protein [Pseudoroseicyclus aestuarii]
MTLLRLTPRLLSGVGLAALASAAAAQDSELMILDYSGFERPEFHAPYAEEHGTEPTYSFFGDEEEAFQKLRSGFEADTAHICAGSVTKWVESGLIEPWDTSRIDAWDDLESALTGSDVTGEGDVYFVPTDFGSTAIAYNPEEVPEEDVSTLAVFNDPAYAGRMTIPDNVDDAYALAYLATGTTDIAGASEEEFQAASDWLRQVHPNLVTYWTDPAELAQMLSSGQVVISWAWNETYPAMADEGRPIGFERTPEEGSSLWVCGLVNIADGPGSEDKVYDYANAVLDPVSAEPLLEDGYGSANRAALEQFDEERLAASGLEQIDAPIAAQLPMPQELRQRQAEEFELIKSGF